MLWNFFLFQHVLYLQIINSFNSLLGKGLPVTQTEIDYILESKQNRDLDIPSESIVDYETFTKKKQLICSQVKNEWNYKITVSLHLIYFTIQSCTSHSTIIFLNFFCFNTIMTSYNYAISVCYCYWEKVTFLHVMHYRHFYSFKRLNWPI